jgi:hypothetical protein
VKRPIWTAASTPLERAGTFAGRHRDEQAARGLGVEQDRGHRIVDVRAHLDLTGTLGSGPLATTGHRTFAREVECAFEVGKRAGVDFDAEPCPVRHLQCMADEPEARHVGRRVHVDRPGAERARRREVQRRHLLHRPERERICGPDESPLERGRDGAHAERLRQEQRVALLRTGVAPEPFGVDDAGDGQAVLDLLVLDRVAACERGASLLDLLEAACEHLAEQVDVERRRPPDEVECGQRLTAHREHVGQRVRRSDPTEPPRVVDDRREEVRRHDESPLCVETEHSRILEPGRAREQVGMGRCPEL